ncbi:sigma-70 family RNA polymerase sigma factor [Streptomyces yaizuensis]|uniref:Sigma-70 family RNA polymerase sigma factor n=1 Tax=Streptomyces yaizuensis TaxID=2989713 RepID=A0ABQ5P677_9ACTN|nr:sigma-70 family RNA polymerase sigma factor [Streptomyces sp. YSPA8]GLF98089.1 sigma-70 family RNA polymerase sigma factor [Streptomyces sp. YSPA8]
MSDGLPDDGPALPAKGRPVDQLPPLPLDFQAFYLINEGFFHAFAELHLGSRPAAEHVVHHAFLEILTGWDDLLQGSDVEQRTLAVLHRHVRRRLDQLDRDPAFVLNGPITRNLDSVRRDLELAEGSSGLYAALLELPPQQYTAIVLRYLLGYKTALVARYMGLSQVTVTYHIRRGKDRLAAQLGLPVQRPGGPEQEES